MSSQYKFNLWDHKGRWLRIYLCFFSSFFLLCDTENLFFSVFLSRFDTKLSIWTNVKQRKKYECYPLSLPIEGSLWLLHCSNLATLRWGGQTWPKVRVEKVGAGVWQAVSKNESTKSGWNCLVNETSDCIICETRIPFYCNCFTTCHSLGLC